MQTLTAEQPQAETDSTLEEVEQLIVFVVDQEEYAVPIGDVREVVDVPELTPVPDSQAYVLGIMNLRGKIVPLIDLEKRLNLQREHPIAHRHVLVTDYDANLMGIRVDEVKEVLKVTKKHIQPTPSMITSKIAPEFLRGVVVITKKAQPNPDADAETEGAEVAQADARILLLLELRKIITADELKSLHANHTTQAGEIDDSPPKEHGTEPQQPETQTNEEEKAE